jgi:hypothetical protein
MLCCENAQGTRCTLLRKFLHVPTKLDLTLQFDINYEIRKDKGNENEK